MPQLSWRACAVFLSLAVLLPSAISAPVLNELYYHPPHTRAEDTSAEWIEIHNTDTAAAADLSGWRLSAAVDFIFPAGTSIAAGEYLVVAADPTTFSSNHPGGGVALGPWTGRLSNSGETIRLRDAANAEVDQVDYADEGDWATRVRGVLDRGHEGWDWEAPHDGGGRSLELINPLVTNNNGQNWSASAATDGTPGAENSVFAANTAPLFNQVSHTPLVPRSSEAVTVEVELRHGVSLSTASATLFWRLDGGGAFASVPMLFDGGDRFAADVPAQADGEIVEFYIEVSEAGLSRSWPAEVGGGGHLANALYQVDDSFDADLVCVPGAQPIYYVIMTETEREELEQIGSIANQADSNAEFNATFISLESSSTRVRYLASIRNRGASSRRGPPNNHLVKFRSDDPWEGLSSIKFNCQFTHSQVAGSWLYQWLGIEAADSIPVQLRINGTDLAQPGGPRMFGSYARTESLDSDFTSAHWPNDPNGNIYQVRDDEDTGDEGDLKYEGTDPLDYQNTYFKKTNGSEDDWSDLIALTDALNNSPPSTYFEDVSVVLDVEQWVRFLAVDSLVGNREGGLTTGKGDDFALYRGIDDPRFILVPHDLDTVLDQGTRGGNPTLSLFTYTGVDGLDEFLNHPDIVPLYYKACLDLLETKFIPALINPIIDRSVADFASASVVQDMKDFVAARRAGVLAQIPLSYSASTDLPSSIEGYGRTTDGSVTFSGSFHGAHTRSVMVNGQSATLDPRAGVWSMTVGAGGGAVLKPGLNRVVVRFHGGKNGAGEVLHTELLDVWNDTGSTTQVSGTLTGSASQGSLGLTTRNNYVPGVPFLVRVDFRNPDGSYARDVWETTADLTTDVPGVLLTPNTVEIRNGLGSVLVNAGGGGGGTPVIVLAGGGVWNYLDDGSDQGTAWRGVGFDDSGWKSGAAQLGYGDGDEDTEVLYGPNPDNDDNDGSEKFATTYFRGSFEVADASVVTGVDLGIQYDDGATVYINGTEFWRAPNMASDMAFDDFTVGGDDTPSEDFQNFTGISAALLVTGTNTIAVEVKQGDASSSDISFDLELTTQTAGMGTDPGDFTITASSGGQTASKAMTSLTPAPAMTVAFGTLPGASTDWSGVIHVTDDVTVPAGHVLNIARGTLILIDGDATPESTAGKDIIVEGTVNSLGTEALPIAFTATVPDNIWGQILFDECEGADFTFTNIHRAGHSPRGGHTGHGRVLRILGSAVSFEDCSVTDNRGKVGETAAAGGTDSEMTFRRCHWARSVMGIETFDTGVLVEDCYITDMLGIYREDGVTDDDDAIYLHGAGAGQSIILRGLTVAYVDDDGVDTLGADVVIEDLISRNCGDKGASIFNDSVSIDRAVFAGNDIGISAKDGATVSMDHVTVADNISVGVQAENKDGNDAASFYTITNSVIWGNADEIYTDYVDTDITVTYSDIGEVWTGMGNLNTDPLFAAPGAGDYHLGSGSPALGAADPAGIELDMGFYPFMAAGDEVRWAAASGPYHVTDDVTIPDGLTFIIEPGTSVYFDPGTRLTVEGKTQILGTPDMRIQFSHVPGTPFVPDPAGNGGLPDAPPKWDGIKIEDSMNPENRIAHIDVGHAQDTTGSIGIIRSQCVVDDVRFYGTKIRIFYSDDASVILENCRFPDVFAPDQQAAALGLDNVSEQVKGVGAPPVGGRYIIRNNRFGVTKGHNDVIDIDSGRRPEPIVQIIGNTFTDTGDEQVDLGGDAYIAGNFFHNIFKDDETSDRGYANAISTGDAGSGTTIVVARNIFWDVDHAINLKRDTATIFENNTVYKIHPDFVDGHDNPSVASVVNLFIPTDTDPNATAGDGAYLYGNILAEVPRIFSGADDNKPAEPVPTTPLEMFDNIIDPNLADVTIGQNHVGQTVFDLGTGNISSVPLYRDPDNGDFSLLPGSPALGAGVFGEDLGALIQEGIFIAGEPPAITTSGDATLTVGGPGFFAYRWRVNGGSWSADTDIGNGFDPPNATVRTSDIVLSGLAVGEYTVEVEGQTFAGDWQQAPTVSKTWTVSASIAASLRLNEISAIGDWVELFNPGTSEFELTGVTLSDDPEDPNRLSLMGVPVPAGGYIVVDTGAFGFGIGLDGETLTLYQNSAEVDSVTFGLQTDASTIGRVGHDSSWALTVPTQGEANIAQPIGDFDGVRISEWLVNGEVAFANEFIELSNPEALPVDVSGMMLTDNPNSDAGAMILPPLSFIAGAGYGVVRPAGFSLSAELDQIALFDADGALLDQIVYGPQTEDYSQGVGSGGYEQWSLPTPGIATPDSADPAYVNAQALMAGLRITEIMFNPPGGSDYEFIELKNIGPVALDLTGVRFSNGIGYTFPAMMLAPGEEIVLVDNPGAVMARYPGLEISGEYTGNLRNSGEVVTLQLPAPFEAAILRFDFNDGWVPAADGDGVALQIVDPAAKVKSWGDGASWEASPFLGSPAGLVITENYADWAVGEGVGAEGEDPDLDGIDNLIEYALGTDPNEPNALPEVFVSGGDLVWALPVRLTRGDVSLIFQVSDDCENWQDIAAVTQATSDLLEHIIRLPIGDPQQYVRAVASTAP